MFSKQIILYLFYNSIFLLLRTENERKGTNQNENIVPVPFQILLNVKQFLRSVANFSDSLRNPLVPERTNWNEYQPCFQTCVFTSKNLHTFFGEHLSLKILIIQKEKKSILLYFTGCVATHRRYIPSSCTL